ncbi:MAG TPA: lysophospholipid acyltransferase family protein [Anaeromyxobacteraceae bacterium]|nr:lysophospholipid acyltransferase family protein [Anaeromyxobacteraceae bacterium]
MGDPSAVTQVRSAYARRREDALERRRWWLASPRGRLRAVAVTVACVLLMCVAAAAMLPVAIATLFRWRRGYAEVMTRWLAVAVLRVAGIERVVHRDAPWPRRQVIYTANHTSTLDPFILLSLGLPDTRYFLRGKYRAFLPMWFICALIGAFFTPPQSRPAARVRCFQRAEQVLRRTGDSVYLSPEGTRIVDGTVGHFNKGTFHLATDLKAPIVPLFIDIAPDVNPGKGFAAMPGTVHVHVLPEISTAGWRLEDLRRNADAVREVYVAFNDAAHAAGPGAVVGAARAALARIPS